MKYTTVIPAIRAKYYLTRQDRRVMVYGAVAIADAAWPEHSWTIPSYEDGVPDYPHVEHFEELIAANGSLSARITLVGTLVGPGFKGDKAA